MFKIYTIRKLKKKGYIFIYTIFAVLILITLVNYSLLLNTSTITVNNYIKEYQLKSDIKEDSKEVLLSEIYNSINLNVQPLSCEGVKEYLVEELNNNVIQEGASKLNDNFICEKSFIEYVEPDKEYEFLEAGVYFQIVTIFSKAYRIREIYKCTIEKENIKFTYVLLSKY
ncbi:hypothetical protein [Haloimpatiens lingqiaonensis]|uniref:hypothetical protein n=1 Tax=Haloimpatiens lingqiaonensis TaxID=1380675 RepID=UPI0010FEF762|nr:hypothetical protein [Haloimpatiens lingqiaonensis]